MPRSAPSTREAIAKALGRFGDPTVSAVEATRALLDAMGYRSTRTERFGPAPGDFLAELEQGGALGRVIDRARIRAATWREADVVFQLTRDEIAFLASGHASLFAPTDVQRSQIESVLVLAVDLGDERWSRGDLARVARELNRCFPMPAVVVFRHRVEEAPAVSIAVLDRRVNRRDAQRDVVDGRISIIKDVIAARPHRGHVDILAELAYESLEKRPSSFRELYNAWLEVLSVEKLNRKFYKELSEWYFWATGIVEFPKGGGKVKERRNAIAVIRLLTRLIFIWFIKERGLVPEALFDEGALRALLVEDPAATPKGRGYYLAVLQNLFFATLNVEMGTERRWARDPGGMTHDQHVTSLYRHRALFKDPDAALAHFAKIPFLNGGLFECLDRDVTDDDLTRNPSLKPLVQDEGNGKALRIDGFSRREKSQPTVPNALFFAESTAVDLNETLGTRGKKYTVRGLIRIFESYKFTIDENTPVEEEVALDPELLGKVFENLLASYNEETQETARKQSGSFYTPRVVVDYMVDEALVAYLAPKLEGVADAEKRLRALLGYASDESPFTREESATLIAAIERMKLLDPACGSGAFPMGALAKLVHVLAKLDPNNELWRAQNRAPLEAAAKAAEEILDPHLQEERRIEAASALEKFERDFANRHYADYARKLYLIEKCIHGVDIQPIAVQIAKLRFFIALVVSQEVDPAKPNLGVSALPNLETKIVAADTLIPLRSGQQPLRSQPVIQCEKELLQANKRYFAARTLKTKRAVREKIVALRDRLAKLAEGDGLLTKKQSRELASWNPFDQNGSAGFFDPEWMFQVEAGFDVVIGNPPYVRQERLGEAKEAYRNLYQSYSGVADLYVYFCERSVELLNSSGVAALIVSNSWLRLKFAEGLRQWLSKNSRPKIIINFDDTNVFDAIIHTSVIVTTKHVNSDSALRVLNWGNRPDRIDDIASVFARESHDVPWRSLGSGPWRLEAEMGRSVLDRIERTGQSVRSLTGSRVYRGITTGFNKAFELDRKTRDAIFEEDERAAEVVKPLLRGQDLERWSPVPSDIWLIFARRGGSLAEHPSVLRHLRRFREFLEPQPVDWNESKRGPWKGRKGGSYEWYEIQDNVGYWEGFERPKIMSTKVSIRPTFSVDSCGYWYLANTAYFFNVEHNIHYVAALMNSMVSSFWSRATFIQRQNGYYEVQPGALERFPTPAADARSIAFVESIARGIAANPHPEVEGLLNGLVYELYFPEDLHKAGIRLFDASGNAGVDRLATLDGKALATAAADLARTLKDTANPLYRQLMQLRAVEVVRIIEGDT